MKSVKAQQLAAKAEAAMKKRLQDTKLLQLKPAPLRERKVVVCYDGSQPVRTDIPYDYIAVGVGAAAKLVNAGATVAAVYLPEGEESDALEAGILIAVDCEEQVDHAHNMIVVDDSWTENYSHVKPVDLALGDIPLTVQRLAALLRYKSVMTQDEAVPRMPRADLVIQLWCPKPAKRWEELCCALRRNAENPLIHKIHVLMESINVATAWSKWPEALQAKIVPVEWSKRLTYGDALEYAKGCTSLNNFVGICNSDIYFDGTIRDLWNMDLTMRCAALLRYDISVADAAAGDDEAAAIFGPRDDSQDCWWFRIHDLHTRSANWEALDFSLGQAGCDNAFAGELVRRRFVVCNPALAIRSYHIHESGVRTYNEYDRVTKGIYATVAPSGLLESRILKESDFKPLKLYVRTHDGRRKIEPWPTSAAADKRAYEAGLSKLYRTSDPKKYSSEFIDTDMKWLTVYQIPAGAIVTEDGLFTSGDGIGFGSNMEQAELAWSQTEFSSISPTAPAPGSTVIVPGANTLWKAGVQSWLLSQIEDVPEATMAGKAPKGIDSLLVHLGSDYAGKALFCNDPTWAIFPGTNVPREPVVEWMRKMLGRGDAESEMYAISGLSTDVIDALDEELDDIQLIGRTTAPLKIVATIKHASLIVGGPQLHDYLWAATQGAEFIDIAPTVAMAEMATACGLRYYPLSIEGLAPAEVARLLLIIMKPAPVIRPVEGLRKVFVPAARDGFHAHPGDSFRELVELWAEAGLCERVYHDGVFVWLDAVGAEGTLLYDRPTLEWLEQAPEAERKWKKAFFGNEQHADGKPWIFWARRPRLLERVRDNDFGSYSKNLVFYGKIENSKQFKVRSQKATGLDWASACDEFEMPVGGAHKYTQQEYLYKLSESRFGLCLPGYGPKCHREVECMAVGTVPIITPGVDMTHYAVPPIEGVHYLRANTPEEARRMATELNDYEWREMACNCRAYFEHYLSPEGSWKITSLT
jgi:hypothetical protein